MLYSISIKGLVEIAEMLLEELIVVSLKLNLSKTHILHSNLDDIDFDVDFIDISADFVNILRDDRCS